MPKETVTRGSHYNILVMKYQERHIDMMMMKMGNM